MGPPNLKSGLFNRSCGKVVHRSKGDVIDRRVFWTEGHDAEQKG